MKRGAENFSGSSANAKKERLDDYGKAAAQNNRNRQTAATDSTESRNLYETGKYNNIRFTIKGFWIGALFWKWHNRIVILELPKNNFLQNYYASSFLVGLNLQHYDFSCWCPPH